ncbi:MAG: aminopeptidase P family protein [Thermoproteales archaeon]|nr:aminopeptidase P family protein [Thermoproteales archaeon]RLE64971.1 MAG: hypothetical protein DRJ47_06310 [Thermoprotei archaeon]
MQEYSRRLEKLKEEMSKENIQLSIIVGTSNIYYFTGFSGGGTLLVPLDDEPLLLVSRLEYARALDHSYVKNIASYSQYKTEAPKEENLILKPREEILIDKIKELKEKVVGCFQPDITLLEKKQKEVPGLSLKNISEIVSKLRSIKSPGEIEVIRKAVEISEKALEKAIEVIETGVREVDVLAEILYVFAKNEALPAFPPIIASGPYSAYPHAEPTNRCFKEGDLIVVDLGAKFKGYCSDMTRTIVLGKPTEKQEDIIETVLAAQEAAFSKLRAGEDAGEVDKAARDIISNRGYGPYFNHSLGHGVGLDVHEAPALAQTKKKRSLEAGMVVTVEPGIYIHGYGGVRIEDLVLVKEDGCESLTTFEKKIFIV